MTKESGGGDPPATTTTASLFAAAASKFSRMGSNRSLSPTASKYRVPSFLAATGVGVATPSATPSSPSARKLNELVRQVSGRSSRNSLKLSDAVVANAAEAVPQDSSSPTRGKLPQKIRGNVTRMRSQLALMANNSTSESPTKSRQRLGSVFVSTSPTAAAAASMLRRRYSRQRRVSVAQQLGITDEDEPAPSLSTSPTKPSREELRPLSNSDPAFVLRFMELLRPLQTSMTSLHDADGLSDEDDEDEEAADALFRQHERENSRVLRICCSLDNLLFAISNQVQENKLDLLAIARGPAQELVQLILNAIRQIVEVMSTNGDETPSLTTKEERYLRDFLAVIADRWSELDDLLRTVYSSSLESMQRELTETQTLYGELKAEKQALEMEMIDIREFSSNQSAATMAVTSNFMRLANEQDSLQHPESEEPDARHEDEHLPGYDLTENHDGRGEHRTAAEEIEMLKKQCEEYGRLLEMAKQEIRLSHQERQSQHARLVEMSQSLLKDTEVAQLRNELQCEKKRVKLLEMESLSLRETQMDLNLKLQSLMLNQPSGAAAVLSPSKPVVKGRGASVTATTATNPQSRARAGSVVLRREEIASALAGSPMQLTVDQSASGSVEKAASSVEPAVALTDKHPVSASSTVSTPSDTKISWLDRILVVAGSDKEDDGLVRRFLADLLMTENELEAAAIQARLRKRASIPTTGSPPRISGPGPPVPTIKKKKLKQVNALQDPNSVAIPVDQWVRDAVVVTSVRQLIWVFYELYLMAEEARCIDPELCGRSKWYTATTPPLASFVLRYFLKRHVSEGEAMVRLQRFVLVLDKLRAEYGDVQLFCEFLEGARSREELNYFLWALQAVEVVDLGVNYDLDTSVVTTNARLGRYVCTLKALYVSRMIYQWLHVKSLKKPAPVSARASAKGKKSTPPTAIAQPQAASPSKKHRKSRPGSAKGAPIAPYVRTAVDVSVEAAQEDAKLSLVAQAREQYAQTVNANSGCPLTLESFNTIVLSFAEVPSLDELRDRLGPFYQPTGDERKVALDVFLVLLVELFATQLDWRKTQLLALFVRLAKEEEIAALLAAKLLQEEIDAAATKGKKEREPPPEKKKSKKAKLSPSKKRQRRAGVDVSNDKYLRGLNRDRLCKFLVQGGLITELADEDVDTLYVAILETTRQTPSDIHFDDVYSALLAFEMLGNSSDAVDFSAWEANDKMTMRGARSELKNDMVDQWRQLSSRAIVLVENDPNTYTRQTARTLVRRVKSIENGSSRRLCCDTEMEMLNSVRSFLAFAWRVSCRRLNANQDRCAQLQWSLTELFYLNQAIATMTGADGHFASSMDLVTSVSGQQRDHLEVFYETKPLSSLLKDLTVNFPVDVIDDKQLADLQCVLQRYAVYLAHLFDHYSSARCAESGIGLTKDQWLEMAHDVELIHDPGLSVGACAALFVTVSAACASASGQPSDENENKRTMQGGGHELVVRKSHFASMLVLAAVKRHQEIKRHDKKHGQSTLSKNQDSPLKLSQIVETFCREVLVPHAFGHRQREFEDHFHRKLASPHVTKVLLDHRAFLRYIFFHFAHDKRDSDESLDAAHDQVREPDNKRLKSKHNSMAFGPFTTFLRAFGLFEAEDSVAVVSSDQVRTVLRLDANGTAYLFRTVMAIESDDDTVMEFDEFAAAIAAIAALRNPHPFLMWHIKIDEFVGELRRRAPRAMASDHDATPR